MILWCENFIPVSNKFESDSVDADKDDEKG